MFIDFDMLSIIVGIIIYLVIAIVIYKKKKDFMLIIFSFIIFVYLINVIRLTFFPIYLYIDMDLPNNILKSINIIPFKDSLNKTSLLNIIMTIPYGMIVPFLFNFKKNRNIIISGLCFSCGIELLQLIEALIAKGFSLRIIDINDVIFNTLGVLIGYVILKMFAKVYLKLNIKTVNTFFKYISTRCEKLMQNKFWDEKCLHSIYRV